MIDRPILDAGPGLNFFSINKERMLFATLGALTMPEAVRDEIEGKATSKKPADLRFAAAERVLQKVPERLLSVASDAATPALTVAVQRIGGVPMAARMRTRKDLGEIMVLAHAAVAAEAGATVTVLIDEGNGQRLAAREQQRLNGLRVSNPTVGRILVIDTITVLERAAGGPHLPDKASLRALYARMRALDDGLLPIERTGLLDLPCWQPVDTEAPPPATV